MSSSRLARATAVAVALATVSLLAPAARAQPRSLTARAVGDVDQDLVFVPVRPCRVIDTRLAGGPLAPGEERQFVISGTVGFEAQGGTPGGCGVPRSAIVRGATAVALNLVAVNPQGPGNLRAWAFSPVPNASVVNYTTGLTVANQVLVEIVGAAEHPTDLAVRADVSATHLVADVTGYFRRPRFEVLHLTQATPVPLDDGACHEVVSCEINAPPGMVLVDAVARFSLDHSATARDEVLLVLTAAQTVCPDDHRAARHAIPAALPSDSSYVFTMPNQVTFAHGGGVVTYRLKAQMTSGASVGDVVSSASINCTVLP